MRLTYPRHVHQRGGVYRVIETDADMTQALAEGWVEYPCSEWPAPDTYREWAPGDAIPAPVAPPKKPRGRPRKAEA